MSAMTTGYGNSDLIEVSVNLDLEFAPSNEAINSLFKESGASNITFSRYMEDVCDGY